MLVDTKFIDPFLYTSGPRNAEVLLVGEAWGKAEDRLKSPFQGAAGNELNKILFDAGFLRSQILCANVVNARPKGNEFTEFLYSNTEAKKLGVPSFKGAYPKPIVIDGIAKLEALILVVQPKLIIGCGNIPLWALTSKAKVSTKAGFKLPGGIMNWRGSQLYYTAPDGHQIPYLPIIHPAAILRSWDLRAPTVHDLKARAQAYLSYKLEWSEPKLNSDYSGDFLKVYNQLNFWIHRATNAKKPLKLAVDIETWKRAHIACIGICDDKTELCIPFFYFDKDGNMIDQFSLPGEVMIIKKLQKLLTHPNVYIIGQNYKYDYQFMYRTWCFKSKFNFDTMLAHHLLWPGTPKSLDYLASLYSHYYCYWKDESQEWDKDLNHQDLWKYNCKDIRNTYEIAIVLEDLLKSQNMTTQYQMQLDQWELTAEMEIDGVKIDTELRSKMNKELSTIAGQLEDYLLNCIPENTRYTAAGGPWFTSPTLTMDIFYRQLGLQEQKNRKTKKPSADAEAIDKLRKLYPWLKGIFDRLELLRSISVFRSHFLEAKLSPDKRIRCSYNIGGTETFRWSSNLNPFDEGTNLQNIPKGDE